MTETTLPPEGGDRIEPVDIQQEMQNSYIDYAMSVIVGRALPEVRDGLKPVHRRILYAMYDNGLPSRPRLREVRASRSPTTMGNYHPHGDSAIYDTLVRLAQPWSLRYPLIDGQGNFGSRGNDRRGGDALHRVPVSRRWRWRCCGISMRRPSISSRTTTVRRRSRRSCRVGSRTCWSTAPAGIAVGMATNIPPHNLR
ncbi:MAG: DNA gyrase subunit A [Mesorhizobium sp.]